MNITTENNTNLNYKEKSISCKAVKGILVYLKINYGDKALKEYLNTIHISHDYLNDSENWLTREQYLQMLESLVEYTGDKLATFKAGLQKVTPEEWQNFWYLTFTDFVQIKTAYANGIKNSYKFNHSSRIEILELTNSRLKMKLIWKEGIKATKYSCLHRHGIFASFPTLWGMPPAQWIEHQCQTDGYDNCIEEYTWQNRPRRFFSLVLPLTVSVLFVGLAGINMQSLDYYKIPVLAVIAFLLGFILDDRKIMRATSKVNSDQNRQLERSLQKLEDKYNELKQVKDMINVSLKEKELLIREVHHRTRNNMLVILSLLDMQSEQFREQQYLEMFQNSENWIRSMALVQEKLYLSDDLVHIDCKDYFNSLLKTYDTHKDRITLITDIKDVTLGLDASILCGLIVNELITNSIKHAFPEDREGKIQISFHPNDKGGTELMVGDNGVGMPEELLSDEIKTLGLQLVTWLTKQLNGNMSYKKENGSQFHIVF